MPEYYCEECNYKTSDRTQWYKHKQRQKHKNNVGNSNDAACANCENYVYLKNSLELSQQLIKEKDEKYVMMVKEKDEKYLTVSQEKDKKYDILRELYFELKKENNFHKELLNDSDESTKETANMYNMISKKYKNAPTLTMISCSKLFGEKNDKCLANHLSYTHNKKITFEYIGDLIVKEVIKSDPSQQSVWVTDVSRQTYIIKSHSKINSSDSTWIRDKTGITFTEKIINPVLEHVKVFCSNYIEKNKKVSLFQNNINLLDSTNNNKLNKLDRGNILMFSKIDHDRKNGVLNKKDSRENDIISGKTRNNKKNIILDQKNNDIKNIIINQKNNNKNNKVLDKNDGNKICAPNQKNDSTKNNKILDKTNNDKKNDTLSKKDCVKVHNETHNNNLLDHASKETTANNELSNDSEETRLKILICLKEIANDITNGALAKAVNRYICPKFSVSTGASVTQ